MASNQSRGGPSVLGPRVRVAYTRTAECGFETEGNANNFLRVLVARERPSNDRMDVPNLVVVESLPE
jgi:hypothetical protein